jgi:hypothetical protein
MSIPRVELFDGQDIAHLKSILPASLRQCVVLEASSPLG